MRWHGRILMEPLVAALLWGGVFTAAKVGLQEIPPLTFTVGQIILAGAFLLALSGRFGWHRLPRPVWQSLLGAGLAQTTFQVLLIQGIHRTTASISAILLATAPLLTAAWLAATAQERLSARQWSGLILGLFGVALVVRAEGVDLGGASLAGRLVALAAAAAWAWYGLVIGPLVRAVGPVRATSGALGIATAVLAPLALSEAGDVDWARVSPLSWAGLAYGALLGLGLATVLWVRSIERWGTQRTMNYSYVEPVAAVVMAAIALGEAVHPNQGIGAILALVGVYLASAPPADPRPGPG